jgi:hypothetical protein
MLKMYIIKWIVFVYLCYPNLPFPSLIVSFLPPTHLHGYEMENKYVFFHVHVMYIEII